MESLGTGFSGGINGVKLRTGLNDLDGHLQPKRCYNIFLIMKTLSACSLGASCCAAFVVVEGDKYAWITAVNTGQRMEWMLATFSVLIISVRRI